MEIEPTPDGYSVELDGGSRVQTKTAVLATGVDWRRLEVEGIDRLQGKSVLYGASRMEAQSVVGKHIFIVGGGNFAGHAAMFFSSYAASVTVLVRGEGLVLTMSQYLITQLNQRQTITVESHTEVISVDGENCLESIHTTTVIAGNEIINEDARMKRVVSIKHEFVEFIPKERQEGVLYVSIPYGTAVHNCFCGWALKVVTPISPVGWQLTFDGETVTPFPSVGNGIFLAARTTSFAATQSFGVKT